MHFGKLNFVAAIVLTMSLGAFAQGYFPGSGEEEDPNASSCVGDGCGITYPNQEKTETISSSELSEENSQTTDTLTADSAKTTVSNETYEDEEEDSRDHFVVESASEYAARKEGFTKQLQFGIRAQGGMNQVFGKKSSGWGMGYDGGIGILGRLPLYRRSLGLQMEFDFSYRKYNYENTVSYGENKAEITQMLFEIPVMLQYFVDEDGLFINAGLNLGLKMSSESVFHQTIESDKKIEKEKHINSLPTVGVEIGAVVDIGFAITRWLIVDLRVVQNLNNMLDIDYIAESTIMGSKLLTMHASLGLSILI